MQCQHGTCVCVRVQVCVCVCACACMCPPAGDRARHGFAGVWGCRPGRVPGHPREGRPRDPRTCLEAGPGGTQDAGDASHKRCGAPRPGGRHRVPQDLQVPTVVQVQADTQAPGGATRWRHQPHWTQPQSGRWKAHWRTPGRQVALGNSPGPGTLPQPFRPGAASRAAFQPTASWVHPCSVWGGLAGKSLSSVKAFFPRKGSRASFLSGLSVPGTCRGTLPPATVQTHLVTPVGTARPPGHLPARTGLCSHWSGSSCPSIPSPSYSPFKACLSLTSSRKPFPSLPSLRPDFPGSLCWTHPASPTQEPRLSVVEEGLLSAWAQHPESQADQARPSSV